MKKKWVDAYMDTAFRFAQLSTAKRLQVGSIIVKDNRIISIGYNGMPHGWSNDCEEEETYLHQDCPGDDYRVVHTGILVTKPEVIHAEMNSIAKLAKYGESALGATMFITHCPCMECSKLIAASGISTVYYKESYRNNHGELHLVKHGIEVIRL